MGQVHTEKVQKQIAYSVKTKNKRKLLDYSRGFLAEVPFRRIICERTELKGL